MESGAVCKRLAPTPNLTLRPASASCWPGAYFAKEASNATREICSALSNHEHQLLEPLISDRKKTATSHSNRELSTIATHSSGCTKLEIIRTRKIGESLRGSLPHRKIRFQPEARCALLTSRLKFTV